MVALDEETVSLVQSVEKPKGRHLGEFPILASIARLACDHQIPYAINKVAQAEWLQGMRKEMINVSQVGRRRFDGNVTKAVKAFALLVSVQRVPTDGDRLSLEHSVVDNE